MLEYFHAGDRRYAQFPALRREARLVHAFATRPLDVSARADERAAKRSARRAQMALDLDFDAARICHCVQIHATEFALIEETSPSGPREGVDALITRATAIPLMTFSADC